MRDSRYYSLNGGSSRHRFEVAAIWVCRVIVAVIAVAGVLLVTGVFAP